MSHRIHDLENTISVLLKTVNELATVKAHVCLGQGMHARGPWRSSATLNQARRRGTSSTMGSRKPFSPWTTYRANRQNAGLQQERSPDYEQHKRGQWHPHGYTVDNHMNNRGLAGNRDTWTQWETQEDNRGFNEHYESGEHRGRQPRYFLWATTHLPAVTSWWLWLCRRCGREGHQSKHSNSELYGYLGIQAINVLLKWKCL